MKSYLNKIFEDKYADGSKDRKERFYAEMQAIDRENAYEFIAKVKDVADYLHEHKIPAFISGEANSSNVFYAMGLLPFDPMELELEHEVFWGYYHIKNRQNKSVIELDIHRDFIEPMISYLESKWNIAGKIITNSRSKRVDVNICEFWIASNDKIPLYHDNWFIDFKNEKFLEYTYNWVLKDFKRFRNEKLSFDDLLLLRVYVSMGSQLEKLRLRTGVSVKKVPCTEHIYRELRYDLNISTEEAAVITARTRMHLNMIADKLISDYPQAKPVIEKYRMYDYIPSKASTLGMFVWSYLTDCEHADDDAGIFS